MRLLVSTTAAALLLGACANQPMPPLVQSSSATPSGVTAGDSIASTPKPSPPGAPLSFQVLRYPNGEAYEVASDRGSVVLIDVWATWCEPCRDALPLYQDLAKQYSPRGLKVYALNIDEDSRSIPNFLADTRLQLPVLLDPGAHMAENLLRVRMMPTTLLLDKKGAVRYRHEGFSENLLSQYQLEIEELLAEKP